MSRKLAVKVCGLTTHEDIEEVVGLGVQYCGFIFYPQSKRYVGDLDLTTEDERVQRVGVFVNESFTFISSHIESHNLKVVQLHGDEGVELIDELNDKYPEIKVWKAISFGQDFPHAAIRKYEKRIENFLFDTQSKSYGGSGKKFSWELLTEYEGSVPYMLSGGISRNDAREILEIAKVDRRLRGVDLNSQFEISPGVKDVSLLKDFLMELS